ncbi:hypothetical protein V8J82_03815 [Gymnodinialimonas sp. 2305UL16-5]|uniref:hypothetical protein n=1 Tax=Gymnodinialimonas mytili TaxID=3126503 RepID=UPI003095FE61
MTHRVMGHLPWGAEWVEHVDLRPVVRIDPPASPAQIAGLERDVPLPASVREVLSEVSAYIEISWELRGRPVLRDGFRDIEYDRLPPEQFLEWSVSFPAGETPPDGAFRYPNPSSGGLRFSLEEVAANRPGALGWIDVYDPARAYDAEDAEHRQLLVDFMARGAPVMTAGNGDWIAVDEREGLGCLIHASHEGEVAGYEIDLDLVGLLTHQAWLGPSGIDFTEIELFSNVAEVVPGDYRVMSAHFDADAPNGRSWREWFWGDLNPVPDTSLLRRCAPLLG